jgi:UDP:flavonoid glycosyltransferase YjiC (YdhE family)
MMPAKRIVLTAVGSLGDLHPYIAIALGLKARGHEAIMATSACYRRKVESLGLGFRTVRPDSDEVADPVVMRRFMDLRRGTARCLQEFILPALRDSYVDTLAATGDADLVVSHTICFAAGLVAEKTGVPWVSTLITPSGVFSAFDPPLLPGYPEVSRLLRPLGPALWGPLGRTLKWITRSWGLPWYRLRKEIGLPRWRGNPLVDHHSPALVLALFSKLLAAKQADWPPQTVVTGFPIFDQGDGPGTRPELTRFLEAGSPPIVFTLGVTAANVAGRFCEESIAAARALGRRAVLLGKRLVPEQAPLPSDVIACEYVPFSRIFPKAAAIVHAGGISSTGLAMRAGRPMLVVPFAHDQPDNAERLKRLGIALMVPGRRYTTTRAVVALRPLLEDPSYARRAAEVGERMRQEDGVEAACDALEAVLQEPSGVRAHSAARGVSPQFQVGA